MSELSRRKISRTTGKIRENFLSRTLSEHHNINLNLPVSTIFENLLDCLERDNIIIIQSSTGSGKTTLLPLLLTTSHNKYTVMCSIPTIPSVISATNFIKSNVLDELDFVGCSFGGNIYYDLHTNKIIYATTRHVFNFLIQIIKKEIMIIPNNFIVMIDEAHHSSIENSALIHLAKFMTKTGYPIKFIITSATLPDINFDDIHNVKTLSCVERKYTISTIWSDVNMVVYHPEHISEIVLAKINKINELLISGTILIFVPGESEAIAVNSVIEKTGGAYDIKLLFSNMQDDEIYEIFSDTIDGMRRIIIATNIAESSITLPDVKFIIDTCTHKILYQDGTMSKLVTTIIPKNNLEQRRGRCGRTSDGYYFPFITEEYFSTLPETCVPDIERVVPYMISLELLSAKLNFSEILNISKDYYMKIIDRLSHYNLIEKTRNTFCANKYKLTSNGLNVCSFPTSLENSILICNIFRKENELIVGCLIVISMIEGSRGRSFWWIPRKYKTVTERKIFIREKYQHFFGKHDIETYLKIFITVCTDIIQDRRDIPIENKFANWSKDFCINNKILRTVINNFKQLISIIFSSKRKSDEYVYLDIINDLSEQIMNDDNIFNICKEFQAVYYENMFTCVQYRNKNKIKYISNKDKTYYIVDDSKISSLMFDKGIPENIIALNIVNIINGSKSIFTISVTFPTEDSEKKVLIPFPMETASSSEMTQLTTDEIIHAKQNTNIQDEERVSNLSEQGDSDIDVDDFSICSEETELDLIPTKQVSDISLQESSEGSSSSETSGEIVVYDPKNFGFIV